MLAWSHNQQHFMNLLPEQNILKISSLPNFNDNNVANEIADEIRRIFGYSRKEDRSNWNVIFKSFFLIFFLIFKLDKSRS